MHYWQMDVFAQRPLSGNGLAVFADARGLSMQTMQALTVELRQFESIFLFPGDQPDEFSARIFTMEEELPFAGHPLIGAAALLHHLHSGDERARWTLQLTHNAVQLTSRRHGKGYYAEMDQGVAEFGQELSAAVANELAAAFGLDSCDRDTRTPATVVSTGLPYVLLPVTAAGLSKARQQRSLDSLLRRCGAAFAFLLDVDGLEGRTWDPAGQVEDIATGSAAGPVAAYLVRHGRRKVGEAFSLHQGRFLQRPSQLDVCVGEDGRVSVGGYVQVVARAKLLIDPE